MSIQKEQIIQTAMSILDRDGLEGVTLRRLAQELGIKAASIYWHIANKDLLLDGMANAILQEHFGAFDFEDDKRDWAEWLNTLAHELRTAMLAHREGARVVAGAHPDIMLVKLWDLTIRILHNGGFGYSQAGTVMVTLINFTFGSVIEEQASPPHSHMPPTSNIFSNAKRDEFQAFSAAMEEWSKEDNDTHFATGVRIFINGVRAEQDGTDSVTDLS